MLFVVVFMLQLLQCIADCLFCLKFAVTHSSMSIPYFCVKRQKLALVYASNLKGITANIKSVCFIELRTS